MPMIEKGKFSQGDALVVGGSNGVGLAATLYLANYCKVYIVDRAVLNIDIPANVELVQFDLLSGDFSLFNKFTTVDKLIITAGFGRLSLFENFSEEMIVQMMTVNATAVMRIIKHFYPKMLGEKDFYTSVMVSIAGFMSSPFFAVYGASKAALKIFIESINVELLKNGTTYQILNVSPGSLKGTNFNGAANDLSLLQSFIEEMISKMMNKEDLFIPQYEEVYKNVLARYAADFRAEGAHSYEYKLKSGRLK